MEGSGRNRGITVLVGLGLLIVGLLTGILAMLFWVDLRPAPSAPALMAEQVELGGRDLVRPVPVADSSAPAMPVDIGQLNGLFREVAARVRPSVVYIQVEAQAADMLPNEWFHNFDDEARERFFRERAPRQSVGSGVVISPDGYIITNNHVVADASDILVTLTDKRQYPAEVVGTDPSTDLAVLKIQEEADLEVVPFGDSDQLTVGEWVLAVGNPFRLTSTVTAGIISALGRQVNIIDDTFGIEDFIQTDAAINPGNSGGALVNLNGELIGISTAIATESGSYEGYGFAVPVNLMERVAEDLIAHGEVQRGYLGVSILEVGAREARRLGLDYVGGVRLDEVQRGGAAHRGGLREGDVVLSINGWRVDAPNELQRTIARYRPGDRLTVEVWRSGSRQEFLIELLGRDDPSYQQWFSDLRQNNRPPAVPELQPEAPEAENFELSGWGLGLRDLTEKEQKVFGLEEGAYIAYVKQGGLASRAGLPRDVVIDRIGEEEVTSMNDALEMLEGAAGRESVLVRVQRRDGIRAFYEVAVPGE